MAAEENDFVTGMNIGFAADIDHALVHADGADLGDAVAMIEDVDFPRQDTRIAIGITDRQGRDFPARRCRIMAAIADRRPGVDEFDMGNAAAQGHDRPQVIGLDIDIRRRFAAVHDDARPDHVTIVFRQFQGSRTVAAVAQGDVDAFFFHALAHPAEVAVLFARKGLVLDIGDGKMSEHAADLDVGQGGDGLDFRDAKFIDLETDAAHARIDGDVDAQGLAQALGFLREKFSVLQVEDGRFDVIGQEFFRPPGIGMAEDEDFLVDMRVAAKFDGFVQAGYGKTIGAVFGKGLSQFDAAVTVGIGLDDGGNLDVRTDVFADLAHIVSGCVQVDLGPDGAARKIHGTFICIHRYRLPIGNVIYISLS